MDEKKSKWLEHLTEAESSGLKLSAAQGFTAFSHTATDD